MVVDFKRPILGIDGEAVVAFDADGKPNGSLLLSTVSTNALLSRFADEKDISGEDMVKRYDLALKIHNAPIPGLELNPEEIVLLRKLIAKGVGPLVCGRAWELLETPIAPSK